MWGFKPIDDTKHKILRDANERYRDGNFGDALTAINFGFRCDVDFKPFYKLVKKILSKLRETEPERLFDAALRDFSSFEPFVQLANFFHDADRVDLEIVFLEKALSLHTADDDLIHDLALAYARDFKIADALAVLERVEPGQFFWTTWLWCKLKILCGSIDGVETEINRISTHPEVEASANRIVIDKLVELKETLLRYRSVAKPRQHIRDWHFIQYGSAILDCQDSSDAVHLKVMRPEPETSSQPGGRYVSVTDDQRSVDSLVKQLKLFLTTLEIDIGRVYYLSDQKSQALGQLIGKELNVSSQAYKMEAPCRECLIVGLRTEDFNAHPELSEIHNGQLIFALQHNWLEPSAIVPDIIGFVSQYYEVEITEIPTAVSEFQETEAFFKEHRDYLKGVGCKGGGIRYNFVVESPVETPHYGYNRSLAYNPEYDIQNWTNILVTRG